MNSDINTDYNVDIYTAGLFDGEGSVSLCKIKSGNSFRAPRVSISSTTYELMCFLKDEYGGYISNKRVYKDHHLQSYVWAPSSLPVAFEFLRRIRPYMREPEKMRRVDLILDKYKKVTPRNGRYSEVQLAEKHAFEKEFFKNTTKDKRLLKL